MMFWLISCHSDVCKRHIERCQGTSSVRSQRRRRYQDQLNELTREEIGDEEQTEVDEPEEILTMIDNGEPLFQSQENVWHNQHQQLGVDVDLVVDDSWQDQQQQHESPSLTSPGSTYVFSLFYKHPTLT